MKKYRAKETVEAQRWNPGEEIPGMEIKLTETPRCGPHGLYAFEPGGPPFCRIFAGDWLVIDEDGFRHVLTNDEFQRKYEEVEG